MSATDSAPSVLGDFVLAVGPGTADWLGKLDGFSPVSAPGEAVQAACKGAVHQGTGDDGTRWLAVADLVGGKLADGSRALDAHAGTLPQRDWRGRFVQVAWQPGERRVV